MNTAYISCIRPTQYTDGQGEPISAQVGTTQHVAQCSLSLLRGPYCTTAVSSAPGALRDLNQPEVLEPSQPVTLEGLIYCLSQTSSAEVYNY